MKNKIILIVLLFAFNYVKSQVSDTETFTLQNVVDEVNPTTDDLVDCISDAEVDLYDPTYYASPATSLLEFRNYGYEGNLGYLYNTVTIAHSSFTPTNWKIPSNSDWEVLATYLGDVFPDTYIAGGKMKDVGYDYWDSPNTGATNSSGWTGLGGGWRGTGGGFSSVRQLSFWWSSTVASGDRDNNTYELLYTNDDLTGPFFNNSEHRQGAYVRLIWDGVGTAPEYVQDYEGHIYETITIGSQTWTKQNWYSKYLYVAGVVMLNIESQTTWDAAGIGDFYYCSYLNNIRYSYTTFPPTWGITAYPAAKTFAWDDYPILTFIEIDLAPDALFVVAQGGDADKFTITVNQVEDRIEVETKGDNGGVSPFELTLTVSASGYSDEVITISQNSKF